METPTQKIYGLLTKFDTAMLVTQGRDQLPHARPMGVVKVDPNCDTWFFTARDSEKTREIAQKQQVMLVFQNSHKCSVSLVGEAELISDRGRIAELWKESYKVWFPQGANDPNLILIRVNAAQAEYWDASGFQGVKYMFEAAKAYVTGTTPAPDAEQHDRVVLR